MVREQQRVVTPVFEIRDDAVAQLRCPRHAEGHERHRSHHQDKLRQQIVRNLFAHNGKPCRRRGMRVHDGLHVGAMAQDAQV